MLKTPIALAVLAALSLGPISAHALGSDIDSSSPQDTSATADTKADTKTDTKTDTKARRLDAVTVTGSLIPRSEVETATPVITITADQMKARGFATVADALQQASFATGGVQGPQTSASFTQGAQTLSMFGLPVGFTKYLINGRSMGNFPGLYNGSDSFNNISGIPAEMVDHIDILPGGQSSLYGSDAIAGVINIVLKTKIDAPAVDVRYGWHPDGGGADRRVSIVDGYNKGAFNIIGGIQYESTQPIWSGDRSLTSQYYTEGTSPATASRDYLVYSATKSKNAYYFLDPNNCANVTSTGYGTEGLRTRANSGSYCGSFYSPSYSTLQNDQQTVNAYTHTTFDLNDNTQLYGDLLYNYDEQKYDSGANYTWWGTGADYGAYWDPNLQDFVNLQRGFTPEEVGGFKNIMNKQYDRSYMLDFGVKGSFGDSNWDYDLSATHSDDHLETRDWVRWAGAMDAYFEQHVLGAQQGYDPVYNYYPVFTPNYAAFYQPISAADMAKMTGYITTKAKTWDNTFRGVITNSSLFSLPGGDAGIAVLAEGGNEGWDYSPDQRLLDGDVWGQTDVQGAGHRSRYASTVELNMPLAKMLTLDVAGRYDAYKVAGQTVDHATWNASLEFRPFETLLLRGKYGTAFKAPTLSDEFQGQSGYYSYVTDYYGCANAGYAGANLGDCPSKYSDVQFFGTQSGNTELKPITAKVWNYGLVWSPVQNMAIKADYFHWNISNEVSEESADALSLLDYQCLSGIQDASTPSCQTAYAQVTRDTQGNITAIYTPKVNVSKEVDNAVVAEFQYSHGIGAWGRLSYDVSYTNILKHTYQQYAGDPSIDLLRSPYYSTDFKTKVNGSITWSKNKWSATVYGNRYGETPNYLAQVYDSYAYAGTGKVAPWIVWNFSVNYAPVEKVSLSLMMENAFNAMPPADHSYPGTSSSPYNSSDYNVYGRAVYLEARYKF